MARMFVTQEGGIVDAVRAVRQTRKPFEIVSAGTKRDFGRPLTGLDVLDVSGLAGIVAYEPEELTITVKPGTAIAEIGAVLAERHQHLGFDPADWAALYGKSGTGTIGGAICADACGSARVRYGAARDHVLGIRGVNGFGEAFAAGGKVVKNVTGFDIPKLVCGAMGTLAILTEITLRVMPKPRQSVTLAAEGIAPVDGFALLRKVWASPLDASGLAYLPERQTALIRLDGADAPLREKCDALRVLIACELKTVEDGDAQFRRIGAGAMFTNTAHDVWRVMLPPTKAAEIAQTVAAPVWCGDWAGGLLWIGLRNGDVAAARNLRTLVGAAGGHATLVRANADMRARVGAFAPEPPPRAALSRSVKAAFDPLSLFNPGRMYETL